MSTKKDTEHFIVIYFKNNKFQLQEKLQYSYCDNKYGLTHKLI